MDKNRGMLFYKTLSPIFVLKISVFYVGRNLRMYVYLIRINTKKNEKEVVLLYCRDSVFISRLSEFAARAGLVS